MKIPKNKVMTYHGINGSWLEITGSGCHQEMVASNGIMMNGDIDFDISGNKILAKLHYGIGDNGKYHDVLNLGNEKRAWAVWKSIMLS